MKPLVLASFFAFAAAWPELSAADPKDCTIVLGGGGTHSTDEKWNGLWLEVNKQVSENAAAELRRQGYRVESVFSDKATDQERFTEVFLNMELYDCSRVLQISHILTPGTKNTPAGLAWDVGLMHLERKAKQAGKQQTGHMASDYSKTYRYELTPQTMESMSVSGTGQMIARDVIASGALPAGSRATGASDPLPAAKP
jgi:hypothetical protein